jgi:hypothetical protein
MSEIEHKRSKDRQEDYLFYLGEAHTNAQIALDILYERNGPKRSLLHRMLLGRAQSILIGLFVQEAARQNKEEEYGSK